MRDTSASCPNCVLSPLLDFFNGLVKIADLFGIVDIVFVLAVCL